MKPNALQILQNKKKNLSVSYVPDNKIRTTAESICM